MIVVIFSAEIAELDNEYHATASHLRDLAMQRYGCVDFVSFTEGTRELAISYWPSEAHIKTWRRDPEHIRALELGKSKWYRSFKVEIAHIRSQYGNVD